MEIEICDEFFYRVKGKDEDFFKTFNTSKENVLRNNNKINFYNGEWIKIKINDFVIHTVKPTQTLSQIANLYNKSEEAILSENNLQTNKLFIGQQLKISKKNPL